MKEKIKRNKILISCFVVMTFLGYISTATNMSTEEYNVLLENKQKIEQQIIEVENEIDEVQKEVDKLQEQKDEKERLVKIEAEKKAEEERKAAEEEAKRKSEEERLAKESQTNSNNSKTYSGSNDFINTTPSGELVWIPQKGDKYHRINKCGNMNPSKAKQITLSEAESRGYEPCKKCY